MQINKLLSNSNTLLIYNAQPFVYNEITKTNKGGLPHDRRQHQDTPS